MDSNFRLYFRCILNFQNFSYVNNLSQSFKNDYIIMDVKSVYFLILHLRFSSLFYSTQLVDIFAYEIPALSTPTVDYSRKDLSLGVSKFGVLGKGLSLVSLYNFHVLNTQNRFFIFVQSSANLPTQEFLGSKTSMLTSVTELFSAANWLEREVSELHGVSFSAKKDLRNLMLQYGDTSAPFQKFFPSIGLKEMYYNPVKDTIIQNPVSIQI